jgi:hypothetical protein
MGITLEDFIKALDAIGENIDYLFTCHPWISNEDKEKIRSQHGDLLQLFCDIENKSKIAND